MNSLHTPLDSHHQKPEPHSADLQPKHTATPLPQTPPLSQTPPTNQGQEITIKVPWPPPQPPPLPWPAPPPSGLRPINDRPPPPPWPSHSVINIYKYRRLSGNKIYSRESKDTTFTPLQTPIVHFTYVIDRRQERGINMPFQLYRTSLVYS